MTLHPRYVDRPLVYLSGPISLDITGSVLPAAERARKLHKAGACALVPHVSILWDIVQPFTPEGERWQPEDWVEYDLALVSRCDGLYRMPGASYGADREVGFAHSAEIPVYLESEAMRSVFDTHSHYPSIATWVEKLDRGAA